MATSKSAKETFSRLGMFGDRDMPRINHIHDPNARKIIEQSDKTFGNQIPQRGPEGPLITIGTPFDISIIVEQLLIPNLGH